MTLFSENCTLHLHGEPVALTVARSKRRRRTIAFKVNDDGSLCAHVPWRTSARALQKALTHCEGWVLREQGRRKNRPLPFTDGATFSVLGHDCVIRVSRGDRGACALSPGVLRVCVSDELLSDEGVRQEVRLEILLWIKRLARKKLRKRLDLWAGRLGVRYSRFVLTDPEQRWGSCSVDNVIRLNWRLIMAPFPLLDYVVAHELCHVTHKDHSSRFWHMLAKAMPDVKSRRQALRSLEKNLLI